MLQHEMEEMGIYKQVMYIHLFVCLVCLLYPGSCCVLKATVSLHSREHWVWVCEQESCDSRWGLVTGSCGRGDPTLVSQIWSEEAV